jgi:prepilin-type N-terminal cleavage/methylation domain-containing protein
MKRKTNNKQNAFTLVELLTTLAVVGILLAILIPALTAVQKKALNVKQKAQFHTIGLGLEAFNSDTGDYPPSAYAAKYGYYTPAQRLAEAMIGRDGLGFHSESAFNESGWSGGKPLYRNDPQFDAFYTDDAAKQANLNARRGPYLELESANAVQLGSIYGTSLDTLQADTFVLVDVFRMVKHLGTGKQTGMPILYYRADKTKIAHSAASPDTSTYNVLDSLYTSTSASAKGILGQIVPFSGGAHPLRTDFTPFYNALQNPNFTSPVRPYRAESFILHSAGPDGLYGTIDDVFNFDSEK